MCSTPTKPSEYIRCGRCNNIVNPTDRWELDWPNYGFIVLGYHSCIDDSLRGNPAPEPRTDHRDHPAVLAEHTGYQQVAFAWGGKPHRLETPLNAKGYRLCVDCQEQMLVTLGRFFRMRRDHIGGSPSWKDDIVGEQIQTSCQVWGLPSGYTVGRKGDGFAVFGEGGVVVAEGATPLEAMVVAHGPILEARLAAMRVFDASAGVTGAAAPVSASPESLPSGRASVDGGAA